MTLATARPPTELLCSVIVPVYNGVALITRCLDALACQTVPSTEYEIILVDDGSQDATAAVVTAWAEAHPAHCLRLVRQANAGPAAARNHGAQLARAGLLLFTDGDCAPQPDWIAAMMAAFAAQGESDRTRGRESDIDAVIDEVIGVKGAYVTEQQELVARFVQAEYEDRYDRMAQLPRIDFIDTYSAGYRRSVFLENGGFDPIFTTASVEDQEFSFRLAQKGYTLRFAPAAQVAHLHDENLAEYVRRKYYIGYWKALLTRWHPERMVQDSHTPQVLKVQIVLVAALLGLLGVGLLGVLWSPLLWAWAGAGGVLLLFLLSTLPFLAKLARRSWALAAIGPVMLLARASALGAGYLAGTIHFSQRRHQTDAPGSTPTATPSAHGMRQAVIPGWKRATKRSVDIVGALVGLAISIPFVLAAAVAIKLDSPGPVFYVQQRIGENGRPFRILKLRSMVCDAEDRLDELVDLNALDEPVFKLHDDPRVTRVGRLLRRTSLDEAPQFYNVLRGEMSLVGPRPEEARIVALYQDDQRRRLAVKPGMTGPMQVHGRGNLTLTERLRLEQEYIDNYSLTRDFELLVRTLPAIWGGHGAY